MKNLKIALFTLLTGVFISLLSWSENLTTAQSDHVQENLLKMGDFDRSSFQETTEDVALSLNQTDFEVEINSLLDNCQPFLGECASIPNLFFEYGGQIGRDSVIKLQAADFNDDQLKDLIFSTHDGVSIRYQKAGANDFEEPILLEKQTFLIDFVIGDFNNDDLFDVLTVEEQAGSSGQSLHSIYQKAGGGFEHSYNPFSFGRVKYLDSADFNGDGYADLTFQTEDESLKLLINNKNGGFSSLVNIITFAAPAFQRHVLKPKLADVNQDGQTDIIVSWIETDPATSKNTGHLNIYYNNSGSFSTVETYNFASQFSFASDLELFDMNHDGWADIILPFGENTYDLTILYQTNIGFASDVTFYPGPKGLINGIEFGKVDEDAFEDMVIHYSNEVDLNSTINTAIYFLDQSKDLERTHAKTLASGGGFGSRGNNFLVTDIDEDGFPDVFMQESFYYHNQVFHQLFLPQLFDQFYIYNKFEDDFSDPTSGWPIANEQNIQYNYQNGEYVVYHKSDANYGIAAHETPAFEYEIEVKIQKFNRFQGGYGIVTDISPDFSYFKALILFPAFSTYWIAEPGPDGRLIVVQEGRTQSNTGNADYQFRLKRGNGNVQVSINSATITNYSVPEVNHQHRVGFITIPLESKFEVHFDNFKLTPFVQN